MNFVEENDVSVRRLPLWKDTLEKMEPLEFGKLWKTPWLEAALEAPHGTIQFATGIMKINDVLRPQGYKLVSRGQRGTCYHILPAEAVADELLAEANKARQCLRRACELGNGVLLNPTAQLSEAERQRIDRLNQKNASRLLFHARRNPVLPGTQPAQLKEG